MKLAKAAELIDTVIHETLAHYQYPQTHWIRLKTTYLLDRIIREIPHRTQFVGASPDGNSALMLVAARLRHIILVPQGTSRYFLR